MKKKIAVLLALLLILTGCSQASKKVVDYKVDIPDGFESIEMEGVAACWYNGDGSNVNLNITDKDRGFSKIDADALREALITTFQSAYEMEPTISDRYFTSSEVCGMPAYQYCYDIELAGVEMTQLIVCVDADKTYTVTYTDTVGDWLTEFETSAKNIQLITE